MSTLIKKPSELDINPAMSALIYGQPGVGKTSLACSAPDAVLFDFDGGVNRINGAHQIPTVQVHSWEEAMEAFNEVKASPEYRSIVIDTVGKMLAYMEEYIKRTDPKKRKADGSAALLVTRPFKMDGPDTFKTVDTVIQRGKFRRDSVKQILYASNDLYNWHIVWSSTDMYMRGFSGSPYKYFRLAVICNFDKSESLYGFTVQFTPRLQNRLR